jgi:hypothetical protein
MRWLGFVALGCGCRGVVAPVVDAPAVDPGEAWEATLREVVTADGLVDYDALEARRGSLDAYVAWIARDRARVDRENTQHAFWLNAYNALVLYGVLHDDRPASVLDVDGWLPFEGSGFFYERAFIVQREPVSLWEIEHERLRGRVMDFRDHAALNCASRSCPPLRGELYRVQGLEEQLRDQMGRWIDDDARGVRIEDGQAVFNPIFDAFAWDFSFLSAGEDLCTLTSRFAASEKAAQLVRLAEAGCPHRFFEYDWSLNDASAAGADPPVRRRGRGGR